MASSIPPDRHHIAREAKDADDVSPPDAREAKDADEDEAKDGDASPVVRRHFVSAADFSSEKTGPYLFRGPVCVDERLDDEEREAAQMAHAILSVNLTSSMKTAPAFVQAAFEAQLVKFKTFVRLIPDAATYRELVELRQRILEDVLEGRKDDFLREFPRVYEALVSFEEPTAPPTIDEAGLETAWTTMRIQATEVPEAAPKMRHINRVAIKGASLIHNAFIKFGEDFLAPGAPTFV